MINIEKPEGNSTAIIQQAIDRAHAAGGGEVRLGAGIYTVGTLRLKSHVCLYLEPGARLLGSPDIADYDANVQVNRYLNETNLDRCLLYAEDAEDVSLAGCGVVDGNKMAFPNAGDAMRYRPLLLRCLRCKNVRIHGVSLLDAAGWTTAFYLCDGVTISDVRVKNTPHPHGTADGFDFDACKHVTVTNCALDTGDDCICLQSSYPGAVCECVAISNCTMTGTWAGFRIGISSVGDIRDVVIDNIVMHDIGCSGLKIQSTEGGTLENMRFSNIVMRNVPRAVFATLNHFPMTLTAAPDMPHTGRLRDMHFRGITLINEAGVGAQTNYGRDSAHGVVVVGEPGSDIENLTFSDIQLTLEGGGAASGLPVEEMSGLRPEFFVYRHGLPAGAMYFRHVRDVSVREARVRYLRPDSREDIVCEDGEVAVR